MNLSPFLLFGGDCAEAMRFHRSCLGGALGVRLPRDTPMRDPAPAGLHDNVAHAQPTEARHARPLERSRSASGEAGYPGRCSAMAEERRVGALFDPDPWQWGLRGDPHLWWHMAEVLSAEPYPETPGQLAALIERTFEGLTGAPWSTAEPFYLEQYAHGGMSSGYVSPEWWRRTGLPLLLERFAAAES